MVWPKAMMKHCKIELRRQVEYYWECRISIGIDVVSSFYLYFFHSLYQCVMAKVSYNKPELPYKTYSNVCLTKVWLCRFDP